MFVVYIIIIIIVFWLVLLCFLFVFLFYSHSNNERKNITKIILHFLLVYIQHRFQSTCSWFIGHDQYFLPLIMSI